jgi:hypothetical protein
VTRDEARLLAADIALEGDRERVVELILDAVALEREAWEAEREIAESLAPYLYEEVEE